MSPLSHAKSPRGGGVKIRMTIIEVCALSALAVDIIRLIVDIIRLIIEILKYRNDKKD